MSRDPLYKIEATFYAISLAVLGGYAAAAIVKDWVAGAIDKALTESFAAAVDRAMYR